MDSTRQKYNTKPCLLCVALPFLLINAVAFDEAVINNSSSYKQAVINVQIDASKTLCQVPGLFTSSIWISECRLFNIYTAQKYFQDNKPANIHWGLSHILRSSTSFKDFTIRLRQFFTSDKSSFLIKEINKNNVILTVTFDIHAMPPWLSSQPGKHTRPFQGQGWTTESLSPPRDYELWSEVVEYTVRYLYEDLRVNNLGYMVGHEPDLMWIGDKESFFELYKSAVKAVKKVDQSIKIGGIGVCNIMSEKRNEESGKPFLKEFIEYAGKNRLPIDFINWHSFGASLSKFVDDPQTIRQWLKEAGFDERSVKLYPSDWTYWTGNYPADYLDTEEASAYIISALYYMWKGGIEWHGHDFDVQDYVFERDRIAIRPLTTFIGNWALFTIDGVIKPSYNAFVALSMLTLPERKESYLLSIDDGNNNEQLTVIAALNKDKSVKVLISNYVPQDKKSMRSLMLNLKRKLEQHQNYAILRQQIESFKKKIKHKKIINEHDILRYINDLIRKERNKNKTNALILLKKEIVEYSAKSKVFKSINLNFKSLPFNGKAYMTTYTVDKQYSSAGRVNKQTEPKSTDTSCGVGGIIDQLISEAKQNARQKGIKKIEAVLSGQGYSEEQIAHLKRILSLPQEERKKHVKKIIAELGIEKNKRKKLLDLFKKEYDKMYFESLDKINNYPGISLKNSQRRVPIEVKNREFTIELNLMPNSLWLVELHQEGK